MNEPDVFPRTDAIERKLMGNLAEGRPAGLSDEETLELLRALRTYRDIALHFADILAGSAEGLLDRKSTSKSERARQNSIIQTAFNCLKHEGVWTSGTKRGRVTVIERLESITKGG